jgi:hypothetical protein
MQLPRSEPVETEVNWAQARGVQRRQNVHLANANRRFESCACRTEAIGTLSLA